MIEASINPDDLGKELFVNVTYQHPLGYDCTRCGEIEQRVIPITTLRDGTVIFQPGVSTSKTCDCGALYNVIDLPNYLTYSLS